MTVLTLTVKFESCRLCQMCAMTSSGNVKNPNVNWITEDRISKSSGFSFTAKHKTKALSLSLAN